MRNRQLKRMIAVLLSLSLLIQVSLMPNLTAEAGGVKDFVVDKMVDIGIRATCEGVMALSDSAQESGYENVSKATAFVAKWGLMDAAEVAAAEAVELCEEILTELNKLEETVNKNDAAMAEKLGEIQWLQGKTSLSAAKTQDIVNPTKSLIGAMDEFEDYVQTRIAYTKGEATAEELDDAVLDFLFVLSRFTDETPAAGSFKSLGEAVFTTQEVSNEFSTVIDQLVSYMEVTSIHSYSVMSTAMAYAYYYYPFSHQQYDFVMTQVKYQLSVILEVMLMYNEFLALQYDYLSQNVDITSEDGKILYSNYNGWVEYFDDKMEKLAESLVHMFETSYQVSSKQSLSIHDYMRPEDAVKTTLISEYNNGTYHMYRLMTNTDDSKKNIYYLLGDEGMAGQFYDADTGELREMFLQLSSRQSDGVNTFVLPNNADEIKQLFNTYAFSLNGGTIKNTLYDYDENGIVYSLIKDYVDYLTTASYEETDRGLMNKSYSAEFQMIDVNKNFTSMDLFQTEAIEDYENDYKVAAFVKDGIYSQKISAACSGLSGGDMTITSEVDGETLSVGNTKEFVSGEELTISFRLPEDCRDFTLVCKREGSEPEELLNENWLAHMNADNSGYYTITYHMPYSACEFVLNSNQFDYDEDGNVIIKSFEDLNAVANQINENPSIYADATYVMAADIVVPTDQSLASIGTTDEPFTGTFDGAGYTISNLKNALFTKNSGTIKNLDILNASVSEKVAGILTAYNSGDIENVHIYGSEVNSYRQGGAICGVLDGGTICNCSTDENTKVSGYCDMGEQEFATGGIAGILRGETQISDCTNEAYVEHYADNAYINMSYTGGIAGLNSGQANIELCLNTGDILTESEEENHVVGGICGGSTGEIQIRNCGNRGNLSAIITGENIPSYLGGILGGNWTTNDYQSVIENCYSAAKETLTFGTTGGILGNCIGKMTITNCYFDSELFSGETFGGMSQKITVTDSEGKATDKFAAGEVAYLLNKGVTDGTQAWYQSLDNGVTIERYPQLQNNGENTVYYSSGNEGYTNQPVRENYPPEIEGDKNPDENETNAGKNENGNLPAEEADKIWEDSAVKTGDQTPIAYYAIIVAVMAAIIFMLVRKRKNSKVTRGGKSSE